MTTIYYCSAKYAIFTTFFSLFICITYFVFNLFYNIHPTPYIDEVFHIPQAQKFCSGSFTEWEPKLLTLPGFYLISIGALKPFSFISDNYCSVYALRFINVVVSVVNFYLFYYLLKTIHYYEMKNNCLKVVCSGLNLAIFPPLYFFTFLYYTEPVSTSLILLTAILHIRRHFNLAAITGFISVCTRQTNMIWVGLVTLDGVIYYLNSQVRLRGKKISRKMQSSYNYVKILFVSLHDMKDKLLILMGVVNYIGAYILISIIFCAYLFFNRGIVVGDRQANIPTIHIPQLFYFSLFFIFFGSPFCVNKIYPFILFAKKQWKLLSVLAVLIAVTVYLNTLVHPYLLSDNRHYTFYLWKRLYESKIPFRYLLIPVYIFGFYCICDTISHLNFVYKLGFYTCLSLCLVPHRLLEFRYFIIPYIFLRLHIKNVQWWQLILELLINTGVNFVSFYLFFTKIFFWGNIEEPQRIIW